MSDKKNLNNEALDNEELDSVEGMLNEDDGILELTDEDGNVVRFEMMDFIDYDDRSFVVLLPEMVEGDEEPDNTVIIFEVEPSGEDEEIYKPVEDEKTLTAVYDMFKERNQDLDFED